ncbi:MAG: PilZ domain-containing protein [Deltaproteobacteria bacterium]|nr:PilZ domain-containing protein [Deltaproteobacteria bacterium]
MAVQENRLPAEKRSEPRIEAGQFHSVEINLGVPLPIYQFNLRNVSDTGVCILVKQDSPILQHLKVGQVLELKYYAVDESKANIVRRFKTEIRHITKGTPGHYNGHFLVGVAIFSAAQEDLG